MQSSIIIEFPAVEVFHAGDPVYYCRDGCIKRATAHGGWYEARVLGVVLKTSIPTESVKVVTHGLAKGVLYYNSGSVGELFYLGVEGPFCANTEFRKKTCVKKY